MDKILEKFKKVVLPLKTQHKMLQQAFYGLPLLGAAFIYAWWKTNTSDPSIRINGEFVTGEIAKQESIIFLIIGLCAFLVWFAIVFFKFKKK